MSFDFKGRRVVVAGGSRGIGRLIALGFAVAGAGVSICARGAGAPRRWRPRAGRFSASAAPRTLSPAILPMDRPCSATSPMPPPPSAASMSS